MDVFYHILEATCEQHVVSNPQRRSGHNRVKVLGMPESQVSHRRLTVIPAQVEQLKTLRDLMNYFDERFCCIETGLGQQEALSAELQAMTHPAC